jgi:hypothetical protein
MARIDPHAVTVTVDADLASSDIDEIVNALDEAGIDAIVAPFPRRMGLPVEPLTLAIEIPLSVLATAVLQGTGRKAWTAITRVIGRRRRLPADTKDPDPVVLTIYDAQRRVRLDITSGSLADERLWASISRLTGIPDAGPVSLRWDHESATWQVAADEPPVPD